ncbi:MAG: hypothetical protein PPFGHCPK_01508 (plasmid) [Spiroplasma endosymbiont of Drosophila atripex]|nr:MAG: hypothetical protein PPFGHCPK_01508 [Spiroplasma endosymbiont of Drosophila atripex]
MVLNDSFWNIKIAPDGTIWVGGLTSVYKSTDGTNFLNVSKDGNFVSNLKFGLDGTIYSCNTIEVLKSTDGINFTKIGNFGKEGIFSIDVATDGTVYVGTIGTLLMHGKLYKIDIINNLLTMNKPDYVGDKDNGFIYKNEQKIGIKNNYLDKAILDNKNITIPTTDLNILVGKHHLVLILKDEYKALSGNKTGTINFVFFIKNQINELDYTTNIDDTQLYSGLVSNDGNTDGANIIQTKSKVGSLHPANLYLAINDKLIDYRNSFYVQGTVNEITNDFKATGFKQGVSKNLSIKRDGIYHLHLVDVVGNTYDSYLELGENNWKLKGTFDDSELDKLKSKLNVTVNLNDPTQKQQALGWLHQYENFVDKIFEETIKTNGKGFDSEIKNQIASYTTFLKPLIYDISNEPKFDDGINKSLLLKTITDKANEILNKSLDALPKNLNVNTSNVVNKSTLDSYSIWIKGYDTFINNNKDQWINDVVKVSSRGFATKEQENQIKSQVSKFLNNDNIKNYLKNVVWEDNKLLKATSNDYQQYVKLDELQKDTIDWVNTNMSEINTAYENAIKNAESGLNLHGYSIDKILNGRPKPQTKSEIDNFADGKSYHDWLQSQANIKFRGWQLAMGFGIALPLLLVVVAIAWVIRSRTNPRYNGVARARKETKIRKSNFKKSIKNKK